jgi:hypothetical protein
MDETLGFVGRDAEVGKALDALSRGTNLAGQGQGGDWQVRLSPPALRGHAKGTALPVGG